MGSSPIGSERPIRRSRGQSTPREQASSTYADPSRRSERDVEALLLHLLSAPHRPLSLCVDRHASLLAARPRLYGQLAVWYMAHGDAGGHRVVFVGNLLTSRLGSLREAGFVLAQELAPAAVADMVDYMKRWRGKIPRQARTAVVRYLREREADPRRFDRDVAAARAALKHLYATLRIRPSARADAVLFKDRPPPGSLAHAVKRLARARRPAEQARLIIEHRIPYSAASGAVARPSPTVLVALVDATPPQELAHIRARLAPPGRVGDARLEQLIDAKLARSELTADVAPVSRATREPRELLAAIRAVSLPLRQPPATRSYETVVR